AIEPQSQSGRRSSWWAGGSSPSCHATADKPERDARTQRLHRRGGPCNHKTSAKPISKGHPMRLVRLKATGGLENLRLVETDEPRPGPRDLLVRIRACSLNFHDDLVATGKFPSADGRVPLTDGAGDVVAVGSEVEEFKVGDVVVSTFYPDWLT